jgi:FkbM family methyltransferase
MNPWRQKIINGVRYVDSLCRLKRHNWAMLMACFGVSADDVRLVNGTDEAHLIPLDIDLTLAQGQWFLEGYANALQLQRNAGAIFLRSGPEIKVVIEDAAFAITTSEEIYILRELYVNGVYSFSINVPVVVWDVGMNVGFASIFFASRNRALVVGLEPVPYTFDLAVKNISRNLHLSSSITPINAGVASANGIGSIDFHESVKGSTGLYGTRPSLRSIYRTSPVTVRLVDAAEQVSRLAKQYTGHCLVAKIDCEGSEYDIIQTLADHDLIRTIRLYLIEWHRYATGHDPEIIARTLTAHGYTVIFPPHHREAAIGMIYAARSW